MKKKILFITILMLFSINIVNAQEKYVRETIITIQADDSVRLEYTLRANNELLEKYDKTRDDLFDLDSYNVSLQSKGYNIDYLYSNDGSGINIEKTFPNISSISSNKAKKINFTSILEDEYDDSILFQRKRGLFKDIYVGKYLIDYSTVKGNDEASLDEIKKMVTSKFIITLPEKNKKSNSSEISKDGKILTWYLRIGKKNEVSFEYEVIKLTPLIIAITIGIVLLILIFVLSVKMIIKRIVEMNESKIGKVKLPKQKEIKKDKKLYNNGFDNDIAETLNLNKKEDENKTNEQPNEENEQSIKEEEIPTILVEKNNNEKIDLMKPQDEFFNQKPVNAPITEEKKPHEKSELESPDYTGVFNPVFDDLDNDKKD